MDIIGYYPNIVRNLDKLYINTVYGMVGDLRAGMTQLSHIDRGQ